VYFRKLATAIKFQPEQAPAIGPPNRLYKMEFTKGGFVNITYLLFIYFIPQTARFLRYLRRKLLTR